MSFARMAAVVVSGSVLCCTAASAGGPLRPFKHGYWSGGAYVDDRTGAFTHCSAGVAYDSGINLFVLLTVGYRWWLGLINPNGSLRPIPGRRSSSRSTTAFRLTDGRAFRTGNCCSFRCPTAPSCLLPFAAVPSSPSTPRDKHIPSSSTVHRR